MINCLYSILKLNRTQVDSKVTSEWNLTLIFFIFFIFAVQHLTSVVIITNFAEVVTSLVRSPNLLRICRDFHKKRSTEFSFDSTVKIIIRVFLVICVIICDFGGKYVSISNDKRNGFWETVPK